MPVLPQSLHKFGNGTADDEPWTYQHVWARENLAGVQRLTIAPRADHIELLGTLLDVLPEPMWLLYVLVVPRGEGQAGRYQSPEPLSREDVRRFLAEFGSFLERDGRQSLWIRSESGEVMLVYDRHNLLYAYGQLSEFMPILVQRGLIEVQPDSIAVPYPHSHQYHASFDLVAERLLSSFQWHRTPIREQDEL